MAAGHLDAGKIVFGQGEGTVNFNHADQSYQFNAGCEGNGQINQIASATVLSGDTHVIGGRLVANNDLAGTLRIGYQH
ncbi:TPA: hypothetical protein VDU83_006517 [Pseudomonas aeruginosa]|nr:hypothetical protein [Pseudomonas fluorescens]HEP8974099.1 hypothetical protein [Pseudomonas aeruginosa]